MKKAAKGSTQKEEISDKDSELQAIILADNFSNKFWPITLEGSRVNTFSLFISRFLLGFNSFGQCHLNRLCHSISSHK